MHIYIYIYLFIFITIYIHRYVFSLLSLRGLGLPDQALAGQSISEGSGLEDFKEMWGSTGLWGGLCGVFRVVLGFVPVESDLWQRIAPAKK